MLHSLFLGFVFSMIFGHAPTIIPAVTGVAVPFERAFYLHVALLHGSLLVRILGDATTSVELRAWGGLVNVLAILVFAALTVRAALRSARSSLGHHAPHHLTTGHSGSGVRDRCHAPFPPAGATLTVGPAATARSHRVRAMAAHRP
jgi:hypothetical protein